MRGPGEGARGGFVAVGGVNEGEGYRGGGVVVVRGVAAV